MLWWILVALVALVAALVAYLLLVPLKARGRHRKPDTLQAYWKDGDHDDV